MLIADLRIPGAAWVVSAATLAVIASVLWILRDSQFIGNDEWWFATYQPAHLTGYFIPYNGSWSTVSFVTYRGLIHLFGLGTHVPEQAALLSAHGASVTLLFRLVRRRAGDFIATASALLLLVLGFGGNDILFAIEIAFVWAVAFGLLAMDLIDRGADQAWRLAAATIALLLSTASSGIGLAFLAAILVQTLLEPKRRRRLVVPLVALVVNVAYYLVANSHSAGGAHTILGPTPGNLVAIAHYALFGVGAAVAAILGIGPSVGDWQYVCIVPLVAAVMFGCWRGLDSRVIGPLAGLVALFVAAGFGRAIQEGVGDAASARFVYVAAVFLILCVAAAISRIVWRPLTAAAVGAVFAIGIYANQAALHSLADAFSRSFERQSTALETVNAVRRSPDFNVNVNLDWLTTGVITASFLSAEDLHGTAVPSVSLSVLRGKHPFLVDHVLRSALSGGIDMKPTLDTSCAAASHTPASFPLPGGAAANLDVIGRGVAVVSLGYAAAPLPAGQFDVTAGIWSLRVPYVESGFVWRVVVSSASASITEC